MKSSTLDSCYNDEREVYANNNNNIHHALSFYSVQGTVLNSLHKYSIFTVALRAGPILWVRRVRLRDANQHAHIYPLCKEQS